MMQRRQLRQQATIGAMEDETQTRQARYSQTNSEITLQVERVRTSIKEMIMYGVIAVFALILLVGFLVAIFGNLHTFLVSSSTIMQLIVEWIVPAAIVAAVIWILQKLSLAWKDFQLDSLELKRLQAIIDEMNKETERKNNLADAEVEKLRADAARIRAEAAEKEAHALQLRFTLPFDEQGNLAYHDPATGRLAQMRGNYQEHPSLSSLHYSVKQDGLKGPEQQALLTAGELARPTIEEIVDFVERNSLQFVVGRSQITRELIPIEVLEAHIKIIGGTRMGKSSEVATLLEQGRQTHDPQRLLFALLDLENKTSRLFADDPHVLTIRTGYKYVKMHARTSAEVAEYLILLHDLMQHRYEMPEEQLEQEPHILIYVEEFLYWKKTLKQYVSDEIKERALEAFDGLATRGIKANMHLMVCAQVDYADEDLRDAMAQFLAINLSFCVKPSAAQAAGFVSNDLLKQNYAAKQPGQFVIESIGGADLGIAANYDVKAKLRGLSSVSPEPQKQIAPPSETQPKRSRNTGRNEVDPALQAEVELVMQNPGENMKDCIKRVWGAMPGDNTKYQEAKEKYIQVQRIIHSMARRGMQSYQDSEMEE